MINVEVITMSIGQRISNLRKDLGYSQEYVAERLAAGKAIAGHNHAGYPEEDDIRACYEVVGGVVVAYLLVARVKNAVEQGDWPQP